MKNIHSDYWEVIRSIPACITVLLFGRIFMIKNI